MSKKKKQSSCTCGMNCLCCDAQKLQVTCGSRIDSLQYEFDIQDDLKHVSHERHEDHEVRMSPSAMAQKMERDIRRRFWISFILTIPITLYSPFVRSYLGIMLPTPFDVGWFLLVLTSIIVFGPGSLFFKGAYYSLRSKTLNMSVLIATGVGAAYLFSILFMFLGLEDTFFEAAAMLVTFVLFGHWMEMKSRRGTSDALQALFKLVPQKARVLRNGKQEEVPVEELKVNDIVVVRPGDKIPTDGVVTTGESTIDESMITGESVPVFKQKGSSVVGGSINKVGTIQFRVTKIGKETVLAQIISIVELAQQSKAPGQRLADKAAGYLVVFAIGAGITTFFAWYFIAHVSLTKALMFAVSAIVIACPDALGLATPTVVAVGTGIGARLNILIKDAVTLENASKIQVVLLDKTGTLTEGKPTVTDVIPVKDFSQAELLYYAYSAQKASSHPFSQAVHRCAHERKIEPSKAIEDFQELPGKGVKALVDGKQVYVANIVCIAELGIETQSLKKNIEAVLQEGKTVSLVAIDGKLAGLIAVTDTIKATSKKAIKELNNLGIKVVMLTGDHEKVAQYVASKLGIKQYFANVLPAEKSLYVKKMQGEGFFTAMVGDGINDAPALAQADVGIAIGAGTDVAMETAQVILTQSDPLDISRVILLSKATVRKMKQNLFWAAFYNLLAVPIAAGALYTTFGWYLRPEISALLMSASSVLVATNAVLLKRAEPVLKKL